MDNEMIERVTKAIRLRDTTDEYAMARAAIAAMREPTEKMIEAYNKYGHIDIEAYQDMIDAVINE